MDIQIKRPVGVGNELVAITDRLPLRWVRSERPVAVVGSDGPESVHWWQFCLVEMQDVVREQPFEIEDGRIDQEVADP